MKNLPAGAYDAYLLEELRREEPQDPTGAAERPTRERRLGEVLIRARETTVFEVDTLLEASPGRGGTRGGWSLVPGVTHSRLSCSRFRSGQRWGQGEGPFLPAGSTSRSVRASVRSFFDGRPRCVVLRSPASSPVIGFLSDPVFPAALGSGLSVVGRALLTRLSISSGVRVGTGQGIWKEDSARYDYMGSMGFGRHSGGSVLLAEVYRMIFRRLRAHGLEWVYSFPRLYLIDLAPLARADESRGNSPRNG